MCDGAVPGGGYLERRRHTRKYIMLSVTKFVLSDLQIHLNFLWKWIKRVSQHWANEPVQKKLFPLRQLFLLSDELNKYKKNNHLHFQCYQQQCLWGPGTSSLRRSQCSFIITCQLSDFTIPNSKHSQFYCPVFSFVCLSSGCL